jgi:hypothetical protein
MRKKSENEKKKRINGLWMSPLSPSLVALSEEINLHPKLVSIYLF